MIKSLTLSKENLINIEIKKFQNQVYNKEKISIILKIYIVKENNHLNCCMCVGNSKWLFNIRKSCYILIFNTPNSSKSFKNLDKKRHVQM